MCVIAAPPDWALPDRDHAISLGPDDLKLITSGRLTSTRVQGQSIRDELTRLQQPQEAQSENPQSEI